MRNITFFVLLFSSLLYSCGKGGEPLPINPFQASSNSKHLTLLDEEGNAWHYNIARDILTKIEASNLQSMNIANDESGVMAVNHSGSFYHWLVTRPTKLNGAEIATSSFAIFESLPPEYLTDGSLVEYDVAGSCLIFLLSDGTLTSNCPELKEDLKPYEGIRAFAVLPFGKGLSGAFNPSISLLTIDEEGNVAFGYKSKASGDDWESNKIDSLTNIAKVGFAATNNAFPFYAIGNDGTYYMIFNLNEIYRLEGKSIVADMGNFGEGQALIDKEGNVIVTYNEGDDRNLRVKEDIELPFNDKVYGFKFIKRAAVVLESDGTLTRYDHRLKKVRNLSFNRKLENPKRIGDFKLNMDYYKK